MTFGLFLPRRWANGRVLAIPELDLGHPIASRLYAFTVIRPGDALRELLSRTDYMWSLGTTVFPRPTPTGWAMQINGTKGGKSVNHPRQSAPSRERTLMVVARMMGSDSTMIGGLRTFAWDSMRVNATWNSGAGKYDVSGGFTWSDATITTVAGDVQLANDGQLAVFFVRWKSGLQEFFVNGKKQSATGASTKSFVAAFTGTAMGENGGILPEAVAGWERRVSDAEIAVLSEHPFMLFKQPRPVLYSFPSGGAVHELAGDATAGASAAGSLTTGIQLDGDASAAATASGDLTTGIPLAGDATAAAQASGTLSTEIRLAAAALVSATATGSLSTAINLAGSAAFASLAGGALTTQIRLAGAAIAGAVADAGLSTQILLDAAAQAGADASGELTTVPSGLAGDAVAGAAASGALSVQIILAGDAIASVLASGDLTTLGAGAALEGDATVLAIASGGLTTAIQLTGAPVISVTASGELSIGLGMTAEALATVSASAVLSTQIRMEGAAVASALAAGSLSVGTAEHGARRASWRGAARQGWTRPASVQRASRPRQYG